MYGGRRRTELVAELCRRPQRYIYESVLGKNEAGIFLATTTKEPIASSFADEIIARPPASLAMDFVLISNSVNYLVFVDCTVRKSN
jgi:hypothetical protein